MELFDAVGREDLDAVNQLLLNPRINVNITDGGGQTPLIMAAVFGNVAIGYRLIESGADINHVDDDGDTPLIIAVRGGQDQFVVLLLEQPGINLEATTIRPIVGDTVLLIAMERLRIDQISALNVIEMLLRSGANPNVINSNGLTPLRIAILNRLPDLVKLLIDSGADVNQKNNVGRTALMSASLQASVDSLDYLLTVPGIDIDATDIVGKTALMVAAAENRAITVSTLLAAGADPLIVSNQGKRARQYAEHLIVVGQLKRAEAIWRTASYKANQDLQKKFMISRRLRGNQTLPQKELGDYIIRRSEYDNLCIGLQSNLNKPGVIALAKSLQIQTSGKSKITLCKEISDKLII
jgi:ankyrin repeat protein